MGKGLGAKRTQQLTRAELEQVLAVARGDEPADLIVKNIKILDLVNGELSDSCIAIKGKIIAGIGLEYESQKALRIFDATGLTAVPGFIDGHLHVESSMMHPFEFERLTLSTLETSLLAIKK